MKLLLQFALRLSGMEHYDCFTQEVLHDDRNVKSFRSFVTIRSVVDPLAEAVSVG